MFDKERFHNQLALNLGYERIIKDNRYDISIEYRESDRPILHIKGSNNVNIEYDPSEETDSILFHEMDSDLKIIIEATYQAYIKATTSMF